MIGLSEIKDKSQNQIKNFATANIQNKKTDLSDSQIEIDEARSAAVDLVYSVLEDHSFTNLSLDMAFKGKNLSHLDRSFATAISYGTISFIVPIDEILAKYSTVPINKINPVIRTILRTGIWQIFWSNRIPDFAVCNESVNMAKLLTNKVYSSFVNAVLRAILRDKQEIEIKYIINPKELYLRCSLPKELAGYFKKWFGPDRAITICDALNTPSSSKARVNTLKTNIKELIYELEIANCTIEPSVFMDNAFSIKTNGVMLENIPSFKNGEFVIQDEAAMLVGLIANPMPGDKVVDLCSAPGGKTCHMALIMKNQGEITACDIHPVRLSLVKENAEKLGITIIDYKCIDACNLSEEFFSMAKSDVVLADVPCSGLGILGKKPDIRINMTHEKITSLYPVQYQILENASKIVKPGGFLVYSTCTMNPAENQDQIQKFMENHGDTFEAADISPFLPERLETLDPSLLNTAKNGYISLCPDIHGCDGFFIAKLRRKINV